MTIRKTMTSAVTGIMAALVCCLLPHNGYGQTTATEEAGADGKKVVVMENAALKLVINPASGGRISSFVWKPAGQDWVLPGNAGFLMDHVWQQTWPGELLNRPYEVAIVQAGPESAAVQASVTIDGKGDKTIEGVKVVRTITLTGASPKVEVTIRLENPTTEPRSPGFWIQNVINAGGVREGMWSWRPSTRGVIGAHFDSKIGGSVPEKADFVYDPAAGWTAQLHPEKREGVVFLLDYNWLRCLYDNGGSNSAEWWYDQVRLAPGQSFETKVVIWPFRGLQTVTHAESTFVAGLRFEDAGPDLVLVNGLVAGAEGAAGSAKVALELLDYDTGQVIHAATFENVAIGATVAEQKTKLPMPPGAKNLLARATVTTADGKTHVYETYRAGSAVIGTERVYQTRRPPRVRPIERLAVIAKTPHEGLRILHLRGLFHEAYRLPEAAKLMGAELKSGSYKVFVYGPSLSYFPSSYPELMGYDVIVLNNVPLECIDEQSQQYLSDYVEHGGNLLAIGGHWAFGGGGYQGSPLEALLPVTSKGPFDVQAVTDGTLTPAPAPDRAIKAIWLQEVMPRPEATVTVKAGYKPFWIQWRKGKGQAAVLAGLAYGEAPENVQLFNEWDGWPKWLAEQLTKTIRAEEK